MDKGTLITILVTAGVPVIVSAISAILLRLFPKEKVSAQGRALGRKIGIWLDTLGNGKLGKKAMDTLEEGPISTAVRWVISVAEGTLEGLDHDEVKLSVEKKINSDILRAFEEAMK
jgi:hypothetical protein